MRKMLALNKQFLLAEAGLVKEAGTATLEAVYSPLFDTMLILQQVFDPDSLPFSIRAATWKSGHAYTVAYAKSYHEACEKFTTEKYRLNEISRQNLLSGIQEDRAKRKVYKWERDCLQRFDHRISEKEFTRAAYGCARLMGRAFPQIAFGAEQKFSSEGYARETASYNYSYNRIKVPASMRTPITAAHEMTHSVLDDNQKGEEHLFHGPAFVRLSTILYHRVIGVPLNPMITEAKKENIWGLDPESRLSRRIDDLSELCKLPDRQFLSELKRHDLFREFV